MAYPQSQLTGGSVYERFRTIEPMLTILIWPLMLQLTLETFAKVHIPYVLCLVGEFTLFGFFRIIGVALGLAGRPNPRPVRGSHG